MKEPDYNKTIVPIEYFETNPEFAKKVAFAYDDAKEKNASWYGPEIKALTHNNAEEYCQNNGLGYCRVIGELTMEIPCKEGTFEPDFDKAVDYERSQLN